MSTYIANRDSYRKHCVSCTAEPEMIALRPKKCSRLGWIFLVAVANTFVVCTSAHSLPDEPRNSDEISTTTSLESERFSARAGDYGSVSLTDVGSVQAARQTGTLTEFRERLKRAVPGTGRDPRRRRKTSGGGSSELIKSKKSKKSKKSNKSKKGCGIRLAASQLNSHGGNRTVNGTFIPDDGPYRFWNVMTPTNEVFNYDNETGKVTILFRGLYLFNTQVMHFEHAVRRSYGIFINEDENPLCECLTYQPVSGISTYSRCQLTRARRMQAEDKVFLKATNKNRAIVTDPRLTNWDIVKL